MEPLRIGIDGFNLAMSNGTGVATYGLQLVRTLKTMGHRTEGVFGVSVGKDAANREVNFFDNCQRPPDPKKRIPKWQRRAEFLRSLVDQTAYEVPLTDKVEKAGFAERLPDFDRLVSADALFDRAHTHFKVRNRFLRLRMDNPPPIMHWTYPVPIVLEGSRNIYTLHDLVPLKLPYATLDDKDFYRGIVAGCAREAAHICTVSEASRADIHHLLDVPLDRISNTYQIGASGLAASPAEDDARAVEGIFGLKADGYFLFFGAIEPKKNIGRIIEAYLSMQTATPLVIVGARSWQADEELKLMPGGGADGGVGTFVGHRGQTIIRLSYMPRDLLAKLIRGARAVLFPSLYEGFGLPVQESMQVGTPVITSNVSSLPELAGDAAITVDPYDVPGLVTAMRRVDEDEALRRDLGARGMVQAGTFSQEAYRGRLAAMYDVVMTRKAAGA
ncbi:glycosyltransferase family 1 protein [Sphingomonas naphthae]|uniref:Glycosyltransferase family 1 protein n=1 Tax=Sphingomonas naphthae TaxID=1813468 RepID=A0ABY7TNR0_9SPHN|nr:glycosyltransferase family 1 protein [Sphingomonas naphthae]WCT74854.1 glycosyltransferase family 1 protein [Sphingomonas naphthae]